ncbi:MAG: hypothetical protein Q7W54_09700 [Bacteroidota bacterium]|nr:hypothetical protein [Bacteroidota bacterium]
MEVLKSISIFILAGLCEIGGGYLLWLWLKEDKPLWIGLIGLLVLGLYGVVATLQSANFGRVYAAYGGIFHRFGHSLGMESRWFCSRQIRYYRGNYRTCGHGNYHVCTT